MPKEREDKRKSFRMFFEAEVICFMHGKDHLIKGVVRDLSASGIYLNTYDNHEVTGQCNLQLILNGKHSRIDITNISGEIVRSDINGLAISFDNPFEWVALIAIYGNKMKKQNMIDAETLFR